MTTTMAKMKSRQNPRIRQRDVRQFRNRSIEVSVFERLTRYVKEALWWKF